MDWSLKEIAETLGNELDTDKRITRISIDSRDVDKNTLFFAVKGERFDGHDFIESVAEKGVGAVVSHKAVWCGAPVIYVDDTKKALLKLSSYYRCSFPELLVIGLTGSVGKTTTKEMTACVMGRKCKTLKTEAI